MVDGHLTVTITLAVVAITDKEVVEAQVLQYHLRMVTEDNLLLELDQAKLLTTLMYTQVHNLKELR